MSRQKSEFVSALGTTFEMIKLIAEEVYALGGSDNDLRRILQDRQLRQDIAKLLVVKIGDIYPISVSMTTIKGMVVEGHYDWSNNYVSDAHFTVDSPHWADVILKHYGRNMSTEAVLKALDSEGLRPATMSELLALGIKYPDLQKQFPIVELGSAWLRPLSLRRVGYLVCDGDKRGLGLGSVDGDWNDDCRFAAVRK